MKLPDTASGGNVIVLRLPHNLIHCRECTAPMRYIFDPKIRHTCAECGGHSLVAGASLISLAAATPFTTGLSAFS